MTRNCRLLSGQRWKDLAGKSAGRTVRRKPVPGVTRRNPNPVPGVIQNRWIITNPAVRTVRRKTGTRSASAGRSPNTLRVNDQQPSFPPNPPKFLRRRHRHRVGRRGRLRRQGFHLSAEPGKIISLPKTCCLMPRALPARWQVRQQTNLLAGWP